MLDIGKQCQILQEYLDFLGNARELEENITTLMSVC